ncbi:MAG: isochorismate synthase [Verrucomicrobiota bacterium JB022]|nr:isochorismate synthase [Verrucomicrobiota bacterium JB022]
MEVIPTEAHLDPDKDKLRQFLEACRDAAESDQHFKLVSISRTCRHLDPLAVLESIYEPGELHFYLEHPQRNEALAGAEAVVLGTWSGTDRFAQAKAFAEDVLEHTVAVGDVASPFAGPHFFGGFTFFPERQTPQNPPPPTAGNGNLPGPEERKTGQGDPEPYEPDGFDGDFEPATLFVPRWQVGRRGNTYTAVANCRVDPDADIDALTEKIWAAYQKFMTFNYEQAPVSRPNELVRRSEVGPETGYESLVADAVDEIQAGTLDKVVLARALDLHFARPLQPLETLNSLRNRFPTCFSFSFENDSGHSLIGATPERLVRICQGKLQTEALAGSEPRGANARQDAALARALLESSKDRHEHEVVVEELVNGLQTLGIEADYAPEPELVQLANVQHLRTPIAADLPESLHLLDVLRVLHPTPAVGGMPRQGALAHIHDVEHFPRGLYTGIVGWFDHAGNGEFVVGLRSALVKDTHARLFAGAGIVAGSEPDKERRETEVKMQALLEAILEGPQSGLEIKEPTA